MMYGAGSGLVKVCPVEISEGCRWTVKIILPCSRDIVLFIKQ